MQWCKLLWEKDNVETVFYSFSFIAMWKSLVGMIGCICMHHDFLLCNSINWHNSYKGKPNLCLHCTSNFILECHTLLLFPLSQGGKGQATERSAIPLNKDLQQHFPAFQLHDAI